MLKNDTCISGMTREVKTQQDVYLGFIRKFCSNIINAVLMLAHRLQRQPQKSIGSHTISFFFTSRANYVRNIIIDQAELNAVKILTKLTNPSQSNHS